MEYFVSFMHTIGPGHMGFGESVVDIGGPMTAEAISHVREFLEGQYPGEQIAILSFQQLQAEAAPRVRNVVAGDVGSVLQAGTIDNLTIQ